MSGAVDILYGRLLRPVFFRLDAEMAHKITLAILTALERVLPDSTFAPPKEEPGVSVTRWGIRFSNPIGLGAGVDKNGRAAMFWQKFGFGFAELGTVVPEAQDGNPKPRIWRLPDQGGLVNSLGFPSRGCDWFLHRISSYRKRRLGIKLALNIGPNKTSDQGQIIQDYVKLYTKLGPIADFVVINVSSPNTSGLRAWQAPERMLSIFKELRSIKFESGQHPPLLIKLGPDLETAELHDLCRAALEHKVDGIVATNTTLQRGSIGVQTDYPGGVSGQPLKKLARSTIRQVYESTEGQIPIIGVGGIANTEDAYAHIRAGASLVEFCTGLIYGGPSLPMHIRGGLPLLLKKDGFGCIDEAVGADSWGTSKRQFSVG
jgi:dihydroorotate dehydrogenase